MATILLRMEMNAAGNQTKVFSYYTVWLHSSPFLTDIDLLKLGIITKLVSS